MNNGRAKRSPRVQCDFKALQFFVNPVEWGSKSRVKAEYRTVHWFSYSRDLSKNNSHVMSMTETRSEGDRPDWEVQRASIHNFVGKMVSPRKLSRTTRSQRRVSERRQNHVWIADRIDLRKRWRAMKCKIGSNWLSRKVLYLIPTLGLKRALDEHLILLILTHIVLICILDEAKLYQYVMHLLFLFIVVLFSSKAHWLILSFVIIKWDNWPID